MAEAIEKEVATRAASENSLPERWAERSLGTLFPVVGGGTPETSNPDYWDGETPWISSADIDSSGAIAVRKHVSSEGVTNSTTSVVPTGSVIVVTRVGLGKVALAPTALCFSQDSQALLLDGLPVSGRYVAHYMRQAAQQFKSQSRGTTIAGITKKQLLDVPFPLPPLREQERIVAKLEELFSRLDAGLEAVKRTQALLKRYRQSVLRDAVTGELSREWREQNPATETGTDLLSRILAERWERWAQGSKRGPYKEPKGPDTTGLLELPQEWVWASVEQTIYSIRTGTGDVPTDTATPYPVLRSSSVRQGFIDFENIKFLREASEVDRIAPDDLLFTRLNGSLDFVGNCARVKDSDSLLYYPDRIFCAKPVNSTVGKFTVVFFGSPLARQHIKRVAKSTAGHQRISTGAITEQPLPLPPLPEQAYIVSEVERRLSIIDDMAASLAAEVRRAESLRQSILHRAFTGRLVPQDPTDEPASELLKRIQAERGAAGGRGRGRAKVSDAASGSQEGRRQPRKAKVGEQAGDAAAAGQKRGRGRPRKGEAIPEASTVEEAIRLMEARKVERAEGTRMVTLFGED